MKVVINKCFGGFSLSAEGMKRYGELAGFEVFPYVTDYESGDFDRVIRWKNGDKDLCIYYLKEDIGDLPTKEKLNNAVWFHERELKRDDKILVQVVKELKKKANGRCADLKIVTVPDGVDYEIGEYDGMEHIAEKHRTWG